MHPLSRVFALLVAIFVLATPRISPAFFDVGVSVGIAPPTLPVYVQPPCPTPGYLWTPGYWAYDAVDGYYWVPGVWLAPPSFGLLWTPGYWAFNGGYYGWHGGYWGPHIGFYGGVDYGFGYPGSGFYGGAWSGREFRYNTAYANVNTAYIHNTYVNRTVFHNNNFSHASFNGQGGVRAEATPEERAAMNERHTQPTAQQVSHRDAAGRDHSQFASVNHGHPGTAAMNSVNGRRFNQQGRIANGVGSGQLTSGETRNLENREANLHNTVHDEHQANGGALTSQERAQAEHRENKIGNSISADKHNNAQQHYGNNEVGARREEQQQRIAHGIGNGQLTAREATHNEAHQQHINQHIAADRRSNGGRLNGAQRQNVNHRQNQASHQINNARHNAPHAGRKT